jgi:hypothetical protein
MREKLTPAVVKKAMEEKSGVVVWDKSLPGFGLLVTKSGHRSWPVQYKHRGTSHRKNLPGVLDLSPARKRAKAILGAAAAGNDRRGARSSQSSQEYPPVHPR